MALRLHCVPILPSTFSRDQHPRALTFQLKPSSPKPFYVSSSLFLPTSSVLSNIISSSRKCQNLQVRCSIQERFNSRTSINEPPSSEDEPKTRVLAQNIPWTFTVEDVRNLFEKYGTVVDIELAMYDKTKNRGLTFVTMGSAEEAAAALTNLESYEVEGRVLRTEYARIQKRKASVPGYAGPKFTVFVGNLSLNVTSANLKELFGSNVVMAEILDEKEEKPIGCGFVSFKSKEEALAAITTFDGKMFMGRPLRVEFIRKRRKGELKNEKAPTRRVASAGVWSRGLSENVV